MGLAYTVPVAGVDLNSIAAPEISTALNAILTWAAGNIKGTDLSPTAGILGSQLSATAGITNAQLASGGVYVGATYTQGLLSARPAASAVAGSFYYGTDTGQLYASNGTTWQTVIIPGAWQNMTLNSGWSVYSVTEVRARLEGDVVRLSGSVVNTSGVTKTSGNIFSLPTAMQPTQPNTWLQGAPTSVPTGPSVPLYVFTGVGLTSGSSVLAAATISFDGLTFPVT